ncbi:uncharacterized protein LOC135155314 [Lytechinus pictus]|uniref:uncharacterized protein LOC135155313 n=1 Tax=Lytechinus pictus TaxID=7653 RepID=UPI0030BA08DF
MGQRTSVHQQKEMSGSSQVKELTEGNLRGQSPIQFKLVKELTEVNIRDEAPIELKFPSELNDALSDTQRLLVFDHYRWYRYNRHRNIDRYQKLEPYTILDEGDVETTKKVCCKRIGADGGRLRLESFGIELDIPPGAIDSKEPQEISLHVLTDTPNLGDTKDEMSVCFGVQCLAPDDLVLRLPVTYTIPHCAVVTWYSSLTCLKAVLYSGEGEYSPHAVVKERKVLSRSGIPSCNIMKDVLELKIDHFSWAKIMIWIKSLFFRGKRMCFLPFKQMNLPLAKTPVILHAHIFDDVKGNKQEVEEKEKIQGLIPAHIYLPVLVQKAEVDLEMRCYVKKKLIGDIAVVSFDNLTNLTRICVGFELDLGNHSDIVAVSITAGQTKKLEVKCLFQLDFPIPQKLEKDSPLDSAIEHSASSSQTQQTSIQRREGTIE